MTAAVNPRLDINLKHKRLHGLLLALSGVLSGGCRIWPYAILFIHLFMPVKIVSAI